MSAIFELKTNSDGWYQFHFVNSKGEKLLMSAEFEQQDQAEQAIKDLRVGSLMSQQIAKGGVPSGEKFFVIKDGNGQILAKSILFADEMVFDNALHSVKDGACIAEVRYA